MVFPSFTAGGECPWGEHPPFIACSSMWNSLDAVVLLGLRVVLTPLYGSCRPWVIDRFLLVVVEHMLELSCT